MTSNKIRNITAPGRRIEGPILGNIRREVASLLKRQNTGFPGAQPISFARKHLEELSRQDYFVVEKSDGIRYLLYLTEDDQGQEAQYLIDRKNDYWYMPPQSLHFPTATDDQGWHTRTLVDGELVVDDLGGNNLQPKFLVFDCLVLDGKDLMERTLDKRIGYFRQGVFEPYEKLFRKYPQEMEYQAFQLEVKEMSVAYGVEMMFRQIIPDLKHGNDGLIFSCRNAQYHFGTDPFTLKWKPAEENTIDFRVQLRFKEVEPEDDDDDAGGGLLDYDAVPWADLYVFHGDGGGGERYRYFAELHISEDEWETIKGLDDPISNRVVECALDDRGRWRLYRFRDDKPEANHISTVNSVMDSIRDSVSVRELLDAAPGIKVNWKNREKEVKQKQQQQQKR